MQLITFKPIHGGAIALAVLLQFSSPTSMQGAVPPNDTCGGAAAIPAAGPFPYLSPVVTNITDATTTGDLLTPSCQDSVSRSIWYSFAPTQTDLYTFSVAYDTATTVKDTVMAIYTSMGGCTGPFTEVTCDDDEVFPRSAIATTLNAGTTYYIVIWKYALPPPNNGETAIQLRVNKPVQPANDNCSGVETIPSAGPFPHLTAITDTYKATSTNDPPAPTDCVTQAVSHTIWYQFTPAATAIYTFSTCTNTSTTVEDTVMAIYTSSSGCGGIFTKVACNDDGECDEEQRAIITTSLSAGSNYYIVVSEFDAAEPSLGRTLVQLRVTVPPPQFISFEKLPNGNFRTRFSGLNGQAQDYRVQSSTNLIHWADLGPPTSLGPTTFEFVDTNAANFRTRFYRVKSPP